MTQRIELQTFEQKLPTMLATHSGEYVVIAGAEVAKFLPTYEQAIEWGYEHFGLERFFVKQVSQDEPVLHFSRAILSCDT